MIWIPLALYLQKTPDLSKLDHRKVRVTLGTPKCPLANASPLQLTAEVVSVQSSMEHGLSNRAKRLEKNEAMLFLYDQPKVIQIWMKETLIPLTVAFYGNDSKLLNQFLMPVEKDPNNPTLIYSSKGAARAALELAPELYPFKTGILCVGTESSRRKSSKRN
ncbi:MAG: DUF192 domain-containing protein [Methylotenera sp.]|nr:DUF192 domain-containing protein [Oligoflexia bacterium]